MTPGRALGLLILVTALLRLFWGTFLGPGNDEAYHYLYTVHRDWSYYDHPPMTAVLGSVGLVLAGGEVSTGALRLGFILLFAGSTWLMARLTRRFYGDWAGVLAAVALNATAYYGLAASTFALPDGPLLFFWLLTMERLAAALDRPERLNGWIGAGLAWGGAMLSKYHAVFLPLGMLTYLLLEPAARRVLRRRGPYVAAAVGLLVFSPVLFWNATNEWASFAFQGGRAMGSLLPRPDLVAAFLAGQALYLLPWMWIFLLAAFWRRRRPIFAGLRGAGEDGNGGEAPDGSSENLLRHPERFLASFALPPLVLFLLIASLKPVLPHWSLVGFLSLMPLLGADWADWRLKSPRRLAQRVAILLGFVLVGASIFTFQARWGFLQQEGRNTLGVLAVPHDPTVDMIGWDAVASELRRRGLVDRPETFLFTSKWFHSGQLAFALKGEVPVLCYGSQGRSHGFGQWSEPEDWVGQDGILVVVNHSSTEPQVFDRWFESIKPLGGFEVFRAGGVIRKIQLFHCVRQIHPFPFDGREFDPDESHQPPEQARLMVRDARLAPGLRH